MSTEVATYQPHGLSLERDQTWWTERQVAGLRQMGVDEATDGDLLIFFHVCQRTGLDPFARQIHMVSRNTKQGNGWVKKWTIQTGIDGYRLVADRADHRDGTMREYEDTQWCDEDGHWFDVWTKDTAPTAARVTVLRNGKRFPATVLYREYVQTTRDGAPTSMWARMPANQLAKCAESAALRKAYPQDLAGVYTNDEMQQADGHTHNAARPDPVDRLASLTGHAEPVPPTPDSDPVVVEAVEMFAPASGLGRAFFAGIASEGIPESDRLAFVAGAVGRDIASTKELTADEARDILDNLPALAADWLAVQGEE